MTMRKALTLTLILCLAFAGAEAALSALPHTHGSDLDHSRHAGCPVYQMGLHGFQAETAAFVFFVFAALVAFVAPTSPTRELSPVLTPASSRAPPAAS